MITALYVYACAVHNAEWWICDLRVLLWKLLPLSWQCNVTETKKRIGHDIFMKLELFRIHQIIKKNNSSFGLR